VSYLAVFVAVAIADALWTLYVRAAAEGRALHAASYSALIVLAGGVTTVALASSPAYLVPAVCGAFVGTWAVAR
jgi:hypothetical protein